jgi:hypothetical protein
MQPPKIRRRVTLSQVAGALHDLGDFGRKVGGRIGANRRSHDQIEDFCVRQMILGRIGSHRLDLPASIDMLEPDPKGAWPDALITWPNGTTTGLEVTAAGDPDYQEQLTREERIASKLPEGEIAFFDSSVDGFAGAATDAVARDVAVAITPKAKARLSGKKYYAIEVCDLLVYEISDGGELIDSTDTKDVSTVVTNLHFGKYRLPASIGQGFRHIDLLIRQFYVHSLFQSPAIYRLAAEVGENRP